MTPVCFLATKLEAFADRGKDDIYISHDLEDIITLVDGRPELPDEIRSTTAATLLQYIVDCFKNLLKLPNFAEAVEGHLPGDGRDRLPLVLKRFREIATIEFAAADVPLIDGGEI